MTVHDRRRTTLLALAALMLPVQTLWSQDTTRVQSLTLGDAARLAAKQSATAVAARERTAQAEARITEARADLLPNLSAYAQPAGRTVNTATFGFEFPGFNPNGEILGPVNTLDFRARASQTIFDFAAIGRVRSARTTAVASAADATNFAEEAASLAAMAYLRRQRAEAQIGARAADSVLADSLLTIASDQVSAGVGVALDVTRAQSQVALTRAQLIAARSERDRSQLELLRTLNLPLDTPLELTDSLGVVALPDSLTDERAAIDRALRTRPDLRAADEELRASEQSVSAIKAERYPSLSAYGDYGAIGISASHLLGTYTWNVSLNLPILDGFRREGRIEQQKAASREIEVRLRDLHQQAAIEVRGALLDLASARLQVEAARERLRLDQQSYAQAQERFRAGVAGSTDVISTSLSLNASRSALVEALTSFQSARVALVRAEGTVTSLP